MTSATYRLGPGLDFLRRMWQLDHALARLSGRMERTLGVTAPQRLVLRCVGKFPGLGAGDLADLLHLDPSTISSALLRLGRRGLLERRRDPSDRRRVVLRLTAAGLAIDRPITGTAEHAVERLTAEVPPARLAQLERTLTRLTELVEAEQPARARRRAEAAGARPRTVRAPAAGRRRNGGGAGRAAT
ncbi:MAG TPA: MarR family winged helix-turn-helix transcriptional regulator [Kofleriaceae bacterium]|nr:MarR family winged helix-turn-helix transcriptional regulator [Kofleriaceae bacterium]